VISEQPELNVPAAAASPGTPDAAGVALDRPLDLSTPRVLRYANLEMTVQRATITTEVRPAARPLGELAPDQAFAYLDLRVVNPTDRQVTIQRAAIDLILDGESYRDHSNWSAFDFWEAQTNKTVQSIFIVPRTATWAGARLRVTQADREPGEIALDGPPTESLFPIAVAARGEATADNVTYSIVNVEVDIDGDGQRAASGERFVRIRVRVTNNNAGSGGKLVGQNTCRLIIDGVPQSSQRFWSDVLRSNDSTAGTLLFSVPENATAADLQVGEPGGETATIALTINVSAP
jgi:hypothetical protein